MSAAERLLTIAQAAERSECSAKTLRRAIAAGDLAAVRVGSSPRSDRIHPADLAAFWARRRVRQCQSASERTEAIKLPSVTAEERIARLLATGPTPTPKRSSGNGSRQSRTLRLVASQNG